jgi:hypothetical protein
MDAGRNGVGEKKGSGRPAVKIPMYAIDTDGPVSSSNAMSGEAKRQGDRGSECDGALTGLWQAGARRPCEFCDGLGAVAVAASYFGSRNSRIVDAPPRLEVCFGCLGTGEAR